MNLVDVHAHLDFSPLKENVKDIVVRAREVGMSAIVANGVHPQSNREVLELAKLFDIVKPAFGFYPSHVLEVSDDAFDAELDFIREHKPIALGEVGMDFKFSNHEYSLGGPKTQDEEEMKRRQEKCFVKFIALSKELDIPLIVHSRKAELRVIELLEEHKAKKVVMHCFSGKKKLVERIRSHGWTFSIPVIVIKLEQFQTIVKETPLAQLLTETDAPYLGPRSGLTNEPAHVAFSIKKIAELKNMNEREVADQLYMNFQRLFL